jgi:DNA-binding MarR family transcriptional regulator
MERGLIQTQADPTDGRRRLVGLTPAGRALVERSLGQALAITRRTLDPLSPAERATLVGLLRKLA